MDKQDEKIIRAELDNLLNRKSHIWTALLFTTGGTLTIPFSGLDSAYKVSLFIIGLFAMFVLFFAYFNNDLRSDNLLNELKKGG